MFSSLVGEEGERGEGEEGVEEEDFGDRGEEDWSARSMVAEESSSRGGGAGRSSPPFPFSFSCVEEGGAGVDVLLFLACEALLDLLLVLVVVVLLASIIKWGARWHETPSKRS